MQSVRPFLFLALSLCLVVLVPLVIATGCSSEEASTVDMPTKVSTISSEVTTSERPLQPDVALPTGWVTFEAEMYSLALPDSYIVGNPRDTEDAVALDLVLVDRGYGFSVADLQDYDLVALGEPNEYGNSPIVYAFYETNPIYDALDMRQIVDAQLTWLEEGEGVREQEIFLSEITDDRADLVLGGTIYWEDGTFAPILLRLALLKGGSSVCVVEYEYDDILNESLHDVFETSAQSIVVKEWR